MELVIGSSAGTTGDYAYKDRNLKVHCQREKTRVEHSPTRSFEFTTAEELESMTYEI